MNSISINQCELVYFRGGHFANAVKPQIDNGAYRGHQLGGWYLELFPLLARHLLGLVLKSVPT